MSRRWCHVRIASRRAMAVAVIPCPNTVVCGLAYSCTHNSGGTGLTTSLGSQCGPLKGPSCTGPMADWDLGCQKIRIRWRCGMGMHGHGLCGHRDRPCLTASVTSRTRVLHIYRDRDRDRDRYTVAAAAQHLGARRLCSTQGMDRRDRLSVPLVPWVMVQVCTVKSWVELFI